MENFSRHPKVSAYPTDHRRTEQRDGYATDILFLIDDRIHRCHGWGSSATQIEQLQRQLKTLQKSLAELPNQGLPASQLQQQQQLLSQQIQIVQAQIARLQSQKGIEQAEKQLENKQSTASGGNSAATKAQVTSKVTGSSGAADVRQHAQQQSNHPASPAAIEPADPPQVSILA